MVSGGLAGLSGVKWGLVGCITTTNSNHDFTNASCYSSDTDLPCNSWRGLMGFNRFFLLLLLLLTPHSYPYSYPYSIENMYYTNAEFLAELDLVDIGDALKNENLETSLELYNEVIGV